MKTLAASLPGADDVVAAGIEMVCQLVLERGIPVRTMAEVLAVDPDVTLLIGTVELDKAALVRVGRIHGEGLAVPPNTTRVEASLDGPVMGQR